MANAVVVCDREVVLARREDGKEWMEIYGADILCGRMNDNKGERESGKEGLWADYQDGQLSAVFTFFASLIN